MRRIQFVRNATASGWQWLVGVGGHMGAFALLGAAVGVSVFYTLKLDPWWTGLFVFFVFLAVLFGEGAFRLWRDAQDELTELTKPEAFPSHRLEIGMPCYAPIEGQRTYVVFEFRIWNRQPDRDMSLNLSPQCLRDHPQQVLGPYPVGLSTDSPLRNTISLPLAVPAMKDAGGLIVMDSWHPCFEKYEGRTDRDAP